MWCVGDVEFCAADNTQVEVLSPLAEGPVDLPEALSASRMC